MFLFLSFILISLRIVHSDDSNCPTGSVYISQMDICLAVVKNGARTGFYEADVDCTSRGGQLTSIHNAFENTMIYGVAAYKENLQTGAYLGALRRSGQWTWMDGTNVTYTNWAAGQPTVRDDCAILSMSDSKWYSESCGQQNASYFCSLHPKDGTTATGAATTTTPATAYQTTATDAATTTTPSNASCSTGWTQHNGNCYFFKDEYPVYNDWPTSQLICRSMGGELVSIHSQEENAFLTKLANPQPCVTPWIGLQWNGTYSWSDGSTVDFNTATGHEKGPPAVYFLYPSCTGGYAGRWNDGGIKSATYAYICKKPTASSFLELTKETNHNEKNQQKKVA